MNATQTYLTREGDVLDAIAWRIAGSEYAVHALLAANPQLAHYPARLPAGLLLRLPAFDPPPAQTTRTVRLWA